MSREGGWGAKIFSKNNQNIIERANLMRKLFWVGVQKMAKNYFHRMRNKRPVNIARGTTDPEIDSVTWFELGNNMAPFALVANLATRWCHLHKLKIWPPYGSTCISLHRLLALPHYLELPS